jgi:hypothetical protein
MAHIIGLAVAVEPVVWAVAWCIGQARTGVIAKTAPAAMAKESFLMACSSRIAPDEVRALRGFRQLPMW